MTFKEWTRVKPMTITLEAKQRKILMFQFLMVAVNYANVGRAANSARDVDECARQVREAYDLALSLSIWVSFTIDDCGAFDLGSSYVQESFAALRDRAQSVRVRAQVGLDALLSLREWEPMWRDPRPELVLSGAAFEAQAVRRHLKKIEDAAYS
jgi:hypothetical protein